MNEVTGKSSLALKDRAELTMDGIGDVISFDETEIYLHTGSGKLLIEGAGLHITTLDVASGKMKVEGLVTALTYNDRDNSKKGGLFSRGK